MSRIEIRIDVDEGQMSSLTRGRRERVLGKLAEDELAKSIPPRAWKTPQAGALTGLRFRPYTRESLKRAFAEWAALHDGLAPTQRDWSRAGDPKGRWPRAEAVKRIVGGFAAEEGIHTRSWAPCRKDADQWKIFEGLFDAPGGDYCRECFHGSGCREADMSPWRYAVEVVGGLELRSPADWSATRSRSAEHGRNRQIVTAGAKAAPGTRDIDASLGRYVR
jgi:hypothetical protein